MRIAVIGGGPGGLYFSALAKQLDPRREVCVWERNAPDDTFGFGVVFSDETLGGIEHADEVVHARMAEHFAYWDDIDVHFRRTVITSGGHGFAAMERRALLAVLRDRCVELGVDVRHRCPAPEVTELMAGHDLVVAADGARSSTRRRFSPTFRPQLDEGTNRYIWLGTDRVLDAFTFVIADTPHGVMQVHAYPYSASRSTVIVEMTEAVWRAAGFDRTAERPLRRGASDTEAIARLAGIFSDLLGDHQLLANNSRWTRFTTVTNRTWRHENLVLLGDAAHTAHFSIGSGTKLAMEDALSLAACLDEHPSLAAGLDAYEDERRPVVQSTQRAARASLDWFESIGQYVEQDPTQFAFNLLTRSRRVTYDNLALRDAQYAAATNRWFAHSVKGGRTDDPLSPPMFQPLDLCGVTLDNRVVVSAMDMYSAEDGRPGDFHLVHLGSKALGGAGLVMTEMVCVSSTGRITPGCAGLYHRDHEAAWRRLVGFVHGASPAKIGVQLGHSGRKGSTRLMWEGIDEPLPAGNWEVVGPSAVPYSDRNQVPHPLDPGDLDEIEDQFVAAAEAAARAGFDLLELHCAHGYLLSSFLSPLSNRRDDEYGGDRAARLRYPLRVFDSVRAVWPDDRPLSVRISATDWADGGNDGDDGVAIAAAFAEHGADAISVSTGQVVPTERPAFGRSYQTPFADRIRQAVGGPGGVVVVAAGAISSYDDVNSILLAGRADLVAVGRPHLYDPHWTLHAAAEQGYAGPGATWVPPFRAGSRKPPTGREATRPRLELRRSTTPTAAHARWRPAEAGTGATR